MRLVPSPRFKHPGNLKGFAIPDPRFPEFKESSVEIDLRRCEFVESSAVMWCLIYLLSAKGKGAQCTLLVPENMRVCIYLQSLGIFGVLKKNGVEVDDRNVPVGDQARLILPLTDFESESSVEKVANDVVLELIDSGLGAPNIHPVVADTFSELALNAVQHSESNVGAFGYIQYHESVKVRRFICAVADGGIGIRRSLEQNPGLRARVPYDWVAIELAMQERVSGTQDPTRGMGLFGVAEEVRKAQRQLLIHSGIGALRIEEELQSRAWRTKLFPGTLAYASIPC
ncbi:MAG: hypothetical protein J4G01_03685 [Dehalococcoidia bacterium]|nr:hypothetical protein [Dehalococcoidia bacterium]